MPESLKSFNVLPNVARKNYDVVMAERMPALVKMVEESPLNRWEKGSGKIGVITYGIGDMYVREVKETLGADMDILSLAFTNPLPMKLIRDFASPSTGRFLSSKTATAICRKSSRTSGFKVDGKEPFSKLTEWTPALVAEKLGLMRHEQKSERRARSAPAGDLRRLSLPPVRRGSCPAEKEEDN